MEQTLLTLVVVLLSLILVSFWLVLYQLVKQQGRMLLRLEHAEHHLAHAGHEVVTTGVQLERAPVAARGLSAGTPVESFSLPDLNGEVVTLEQFRGRRVLLVYWSPNCGFCDMIAPELAALHEPLLERNVQTVLVSHGDAAANRSLAEEHGLHCPVALLPGSQSLEAFKGLGTPVAYLLDEEGHVAEPLAVGAEQVPALARRLASEGAARKRLPGERPLSESRIVRDGLDAGTPAPAFSLPDIHGRTVSLEDYKGRRVLLVFTDPHCGPCEQLAPELARLHREHRDNGLAVVMVGRGDAEENRRKAEQYGFEFPLVIQERWKLSKQYGTFATPVGFLIDEQGVIARKVGKGADAILALARDGLRAGKGNGNGHALR